MYISTHPHPHPHTFTFFTINISQFSHPLIFNNVLLKLAQNQLIYLTTQTTSPKQKGKKKTVHSLSWHSRYPYIILNNIPRIQFNPMLPFFLSPVSLYAIYVRRCFAASGLSQQTLQLDNETTLHFWGPNPKFSQATQKKPSLVLIHGFGPVAMWQWRNQVQFFSPRFNVYVPDLVFFGDSTTTSAERSEVFQAASVAKLMEKAGVERFSVIGTSYGGFVAYHVARMWPERVEKVVIASSGVNMRRGDNEKLLRRAKLEKIEHLMLPATAVQLQTLIGLAMSRRVDVIPRFLLNDFVQKLYSDKRKEKMELLKGLTLGRDDTPNLSPLPNKEVLIVWGDKDQIFPLEMATELKELLGPKTRLEVIKNTSHVPQVENPIQFNNIVDSFLCDSS